MTHRPTPPPLRTGDESPSGSAVYHPPNDKLRQYWQERRHDAAPGDAEIVANLIRAQRSKSDMTQRKAEQVRQAEERARLAYSVYVTGVTLEDVAAQFNIGRETLKKRWLKMGLRLVGAADPLALQIAALVDEARARGDAVIVVGDKVIQLREGE